MSEQEAYVLRHDRDLCEETKLRRLLGALYSIRLEWLEAAVLLHYYLYGWTLEQVADILDRSLAEVRAARERLLLKAGAVLGYTEPPADLGPITRERQKPYSRKARELEERARQALELHKQGVPWTEIARRMGVTYGALWRYAKEHNIKMQ